MARRLELRLSPRLLATALGLPEGTVISVAVQRLFGHEDTIVIRATSEDFLDTPDDQPPPVVRPIIGYGHLRGGKVGELLIGWEWPHDNGEE